MGLPTQYRLAAALIAAVVILGAILLYGNSRYEAGVRDTTQRFEEADRQGAERVNETADKALERIGDASDPDGLLRDTNGLRDD